MTSTTVKYDEHGLVPAVVQDARTGRVLMLAYMNADSFNRTLECKETWFWSRSRGELWHKGATSGNIQRVTSITIDCDGDAVLIKVNPTGPACHTGAESCFFDAVRGETHESTTSQLGEALETLYTVIKSRELERPEDSYTSYLFNSGLDKILKKIGEESSETIIAAKNSDHDALVKESADLLYHLLVLLVARGVTLSEVGDELSARKTRRSVE